MQSDTNNEPEAQVDANSSSNILDYKVAWSDNDNRYHVFMKPSVTPTPTDLSMTGQITLKVPHGTGSNSFVIDNLTNSVTGVIWTLASRIDAPQEAPEYDYLSFVFSATSPQAFQWQANQEKEMFSFANSASCSGNVIVMPKDDPFNIPQNSASTNPGNQFTNLGWGDSSSNNYNGNYGGAASACSIDASTPDTSVLDYKITWSDVDNKYHIFMKPSVTPNPIDLSMTAQITLKVPHGEGDEKFTVDELSSAVTGTDWSLASHIVAPQEAPNYDYLSFVVNLSNAQAFQWQADQEQEVFNFSNTSNCLGDVAIMEADDPFNQPQNSASTNPGNQFTNLGWGDASTNNYHANYGESHASCTIEASNGDNDLVPNYLESAEEDRDNDGISDKEDFDPTGYMYCVNTGKILDGGSIAIEGPGNVNIVSNGSTGYYQFTMDAAGEYKIHITPPENTIISTQYPASNSALDPTGHDNPYVLGSGENANTGRLSNPSPARNTPWFDHVNVESGDPFVINNNIPLEGAACRDNDSVIDGSEGEGDNPTFKAIPTLSEWMKILLALLVSIVAGRGLLRRGS